MICKRVNPSPAVGHYIKEYVLLHMLFDDKAAPPVKAYPANPEEGITFLIKGGLRAESPERQLTEKKTKIYIFGQPDGRQNFYLTHEFMLVHVRFRPGALFQLLKIPMQQLVHKSIDAELIFGKEITALNDQLANAPDYAAIPPVLDTYFLKVITRVKQYSNPMNTIGGLILENPQHFNLKTMAAAACLSIRQFEKRFVQQIGITPKYYARICRFYQAYELKELRPQLDWLSIAVQTGYSDYQHLVKDFKQFAGTTPNSFLQDAAQNPERRLNIARGFRGV